MKLTIVTGNPGKVREIKDWLNLQTPIEIQHEDFNIPEIQSLNLEKVARQKALDISKIYSEPFIVEDVGIFFEAYHQFPGVFTKYVFKQLGYEGLFQLVEKNNKAFFKSIIVYIDSTLNEPKLFTGITEGSIRRKIDSTISSDFPFDDIFIPNGFEKVYSQLSSEELKHTKHRAKSLNSFSQFFTEHAKTLR